MKDKLHRTQLKCLQDLFPFQDSDIYWIIFINVFNNVFWKRAEKQSYGLFLKIRIWCSLYLQYKYWGSFLKSCTIKHWLFKSALVWFFLKIIIYLFILNLLLGLGFELRVLQLQSKHSTAWTMLPAILLTILLWLFCRWGLANYLPWPALNHVPPDLSLPSR
jgi:hypothetical protein